MPIQVEDGTGLDDANSYGSVADSDIYFEDRGNTDWAALDDDAKEQCLIKATDYIEQRFGRRFVGTAVFEEQALSWPREDTGISMFDYDEDLEIGVIPPKLKYACYEYALRASANPLAPDPVIDASGVTMVTTKQKAGPVEQEFATASGTSQPASVSVLRPYPAADMWLAGLVIATAGRTYR